MTTHDKLVQLALAVSATEGRNPEETWIAFRELRRKANEALRSLEQDNESAAAAKSGFDGSTPDTRDGRVGFEETGRP